MNSDEQLARQNEEELWLEEQKSTIKVNINWKHILKKAKDDSQCNDILEQ